MDSSACKFIVEYHLGPLTEQFGIAHWRITVSYRPADVDDDGRLHRGHCDRMVDYNQAHITLNPEAFETEEEVLKTLRHELFHIVESPYNILWNVIVEAVQGDKVKLDMLESVRTHASEKTIINLERMYHGLTTKIRQDQQAPGACHACQGPATATTASATPLREVPAVQAGRDMG